MLRLKSCRAVSCRHSLIRTVTTAIHGGISVDQLRHFSSPSLAEAQEEAACPAAAAAPSFSPATPQVEAIADYHDRTKHSFERYADTPKGLSWADQPYPFRKYIGIKPVPLRHLPPTEGNPGDQSYHRAFSEFFNPAVINKASLSQLLYDSFAVSVWKQVGDTVWPLRIVPSSGNLHPTECYVISSTMIGISERPYIAHYAAREHALELRAEVPMDIMNELKKDLPFDTIFLVLSSIYWRQAWKYGDRGLRYCHQDMGHAIGAISIAACVQGWDALVLDGWGNADLDHLIGIAGRKEIPAHAPKQGYHPELEQERACCVIAIYPGRRKVTYDHDCKSTALVKISGLTVPSESLLNAVRSRMAGLQWKGRSNELSKQHVWSETLEKAASACEKPTIPTEVSTPALPQYWVYTHHYKPYTLRQLIHKRRSAVKFDGKSILDKEALYQMLWKALPSGYGVDHQGSTNQFPFRILPWNAEVHMVIFAHRIAGLPKGLYILVRNSDHEQQLRQMFRPQFSWEKSENCPAKLPFYKLAESDMEKLSMQLSCHQELGGSGCFSVAMIARFNSLNEKGSWMYPRLHWECGVLGQQLYLEALSMGFSASGLGCYFDDPVHQVLGIQGKEFQSLYHFAVGVAVDDKRILDLPPYPPADKTPDKPAQFY